MNISVSSSRSPEEIIRLLKAELAGTNREATALTVELEKLVVDRTATLQDAQRELERKNARLEALNKELEAFSYSVSHDLRAPLRHLLGFTQALEEDCRDELDEQGRDYVARISESAKQLSELIEALLKFGRTGQQPLNEMAVDFDSLMRGLIAELGADAGKRKIDWVVHPLPAVRGDPALLRQVWVNLLDNALKYTRHQPAARIEIGAKAGQQETVFYIRDNGAGFDMAHYNRLFGLFQRLHRRDEFEGTGIGLANVRRILDRHGGRVWAEAKPGEGAVFYFALPQTAPDAESV